MKQIISSILFFLLVSTQAHAWVLESDFEGGTPGKLADTDPSGAVYALSKTTFSTENPHTGKQSAKAHLDAGDGGSKEWGAYWQFPEFIYEGDEIWARAWIYFPPNFNYSADSHLKGLRLKVVEPDGVTTASYYNVYPSEGSIYILNGPGLSNYWAAGGGDKSDFQFAPGITGWECIEMYVKASTTKGIYRVWRNGKLLINDTTSETLPSGTKGYAISSLHIFTFFNSTGGSPVAQNNFIDDVFITNKLPSNVDANGYPYIGIGDVAILADPKPPTVTP